LVIATDILQQDVKVLMSLSPNIVLLDALFNTGTVEKCLNISIEDGIIEENKEVFTDDKSRAN